jgi:predicted transcriptional regulator
MGDEDLDEGAERDDLLRHTVEIVASYLKASPVPRGELTELIRLVHAALHGLGADQGDKAAPSLKPAVPIAKSIQHEHLVCLEDGKRLKMLKRYLRSTYNLSPDDYRRRWGLPADYPMVAPAYAARRSETAKRIGLGKGVRRKRAED